MRKAPAPPRQKVPISEEQFAVVKRKVTAPTGPRPAGLSAFKPKKLEIDNYEEKLSIPKKGKAKKILDEDEDDESDNDKPGQRNQLGKKGGNSKYRKQDRSHSPSDDESFGSRGRKYPDEDDSEDERDRRRRRNARNRRRDDDEDYEDDDDFDDSRRRPRKETKPKKGQALQSNRKKSGGGGGRDGRPSKQRDRERDRDRDRDRDRSVEEEYSPRRMRDEDERDGPDEESEAAPYDDRFTGRPIPLRTTNITHGGTGTGGVAGGGTSIPLSRETSLAAGSKAGIFNFKPILHSTYRELRIFVMTAPPPGLVVRCYIEREKSFSPFYSLCADLEDGTGRELIVCKKVLRSFSSHYVFSLKAEDLYRKREQRSRLYLGKLRSTNSAEYVLFDNGVMDKPDDEGDMMYEHSEGSAESPQEAKDGRPDVDCSLYRQQMAVVHYNTKTRPVPENLRGMEVCVPVPTHAHKLTVEAKDISHNVNSPTSASATANTQAALNSKSPNIQHPFQQIRDSGRQNELMANRFFVMHEKQSKYDPLSSCLVDFKGRANIASVKNFQLIESPPETGFGSDISARVRGTAREDRDRSEILLQMGKATDQCFNLDFRAPLTMLQAFAIAISRFDAKLKNA